MRSIFTLFFDTPFWVGIYEYHHNDGTVQAARHVFGAEPSDAQLGDWILREGLDLIDRAHRAPRVSPTTPSRCIYSVSPKRMARMIAREAAKPRASTAAQEALSRSIEETKKSVQSQRKHDHHDQEKARYKQKVSKRRAKRRGH